MIKAIIFDYGWTLANQDLDKLYPEAKPLLDGLLKSRFKMGLVSRCSDIEKRKRQLEEKGLSKYFSALDFFEKDDIKDFSKVFKQLDVNPKECVVVGDRVKSEILEGNKIGATTIWVHQGRWVDELPETDEEKPDFTITSLSQVMDIIDSLK